jgi:hypothetical protein
MTPGQEALQEAMRLEQARIYGALQREHREAVAKNEERLAPVVLLAPRRPRRKTA